jgi:hypothetical protein
MFKGCNEIIEGCAQELPVDTSQGADPNVIEQRGPGIVQLSPEIWDDNAAVVKCFVKVGQRSTDTGASGFGVRVVLQTVPEGDDKPALLVAHRKGLSKRPRDRSSLGGELRGNVMFSNQDVGPIGAGADLGDNRMRPEPHNGVVCLLEQQRRFGMDAKAAGNL